MRKALDAALTYLARRALTCFELEQRLLKKEYSRKEIVSAIAKLKEWGYLNDLEYARAYCNAKQNKYSRKRISFELQRKGVKEEIITDVINHFYPATKEIELCTEIAVKVFESEARRWERSYKYKKTYANIPREIFLKQKVSQKLLQKGYSHGTIQKVIEEIEGNL